MRRAGIARRVIVRGRSTTVPATMAAITPPARTAIVRMVTVLMVIARKAIVRRVTVPTVTGRKARVPSGRAVASAVEAAVVVAEAALLN